MSTLQVAQTIDAKIREITGLVPNTETHEKDIFIVGHPKSGTTWFQNLVAGVVYGVDPEFAPYKLVADLVPGHMQLYYKRYGTPSYFKSHSLPRPEYRRVVYILRDGRDVMVSYYHHIRAVKNKSIDFMKVVQGKKVIWPYKWHEHVERWLANPHEAEILMVKYEDLQQDTVRELQRFCDFAGVARDDEYLAHIARKAAFQKLRQKEKRSGINNPNWPEDKLFMRRGQVGSYRDEMPAEVLDAFLQDAGETLRKMGYLDS